MLTSLSKTVKLMSATSLVTLFRLGLGLLVTKSIASHLGAEGMADLGNLSNILMISANLATFGIITGVIRYSAHYKNQYVRLQSYLNTGLSLILIFSILTSIGLFFGSYWLSVHYFGAADYQFVLIILSITTFFGGVAQFANSVINGLAYYKKTLYINILQSLVYAVLIIGLLYGFGIKGVLTAVVIESAVLFPVSLWVYFRLFEIRQTSHRFELKKKQIFDFFGFSVMNVVGVLVTQLSFLELRRYLIEFFSKPEAGLYEAALRFSNILFALSISILGIAYMPKISASEGKAQQQKELFTNAFLMVPVFFLGLLTVYFLRGWIIPLVYAPSFLPMNDFLGWQLLGDFFRCISRLLVYIMFAQKLIWLNVFSEISFFLIFLTMSIVLVSFMHHIKWVAISWSLVNVLFFLFCVFVFRSIIFYKKSSTL